MLPRSPKTLLAPSTSVPDLLSNHAGCQPGLALRFHPDRSCAWRAPIRKEFRKAPVQATPAARMPIAKIQKSLPKEIWPAYEKAKVLNADNWRPPLQRLRAPIDRAPRAYPRIRVETAATP